MNSIYDLLFAVPKEEIIRRLIERVTNESRLLEVSKAVDEDISSLTDLRRAPHSIIVQTARLLEEFTEQDVRDLHEEYRYRGTKTLYIYLYPSEQREDLSNLLHEDNSEGIYQRLTNSVDAAGGISLQIRNLARFDIEPDSIWEAVYSYVAYLQAIDPDTEDVNLPFLVPSESGQIKTW